ncbi:hypothetical protein [Streptomyces sp. NPDC017941]|uniref:hypothetical protein n=1 Tax=Streptomyces sp. NPDC017941 TaxID=3365018 RepID=UPI0037A42620
MTSTDAPAGTFADGSQRLYSYGLTATEWPVLVWLVEHGAANEPLPLSSELLAAEIGRTPAAVEDAYRALVAHGLALPVPPDAHAFQLAAVDAITNRCGCPHTDPTVWPPYGVGQGAPLPPPLTNQ